MIREFTKGRVAIFIDAANIFYSQRTLGWRIDFSRLNTYAQKEVQLSGLYYYTGNIGLHEKQSSFIKKLELLGYNVTAKEVKFIKVPGAANIPKGNLDIELALDAFRLRDTFDTFILFSGDSDFAYLLDLLRKENKQVIVVSMRGHIAKELIARAKYVALPKLRNEIELIEENKISTHEAGRSSLPIVIAPEHQEQGEVIEKEKIKGPDKPALEV